MISINATLFLQIIHFLILAFILNRLLFKPILKQIKDREGHIESTKNKINEVAQETERLQTEYLSVQNSARKSAAKERAQMKKAGLSEAEESLEDSRKEVMSIRADADMKAEKEVKETQPLLSAEAETLAEEISQWVLGRRIEV